MAGFPTTLTPCWNYPAFGPYTAAAISAIAFDRPETVMDGNVERVMARFYDIHDPLPGIQTRAERKSVGSDTRPQRPGDYAQAVMDLGSHNLHARSHRPAASAPA